MGSNSPSTRKMLIVNPMILYVLVIDLNLKSIVSSFRSGSASTVPECRCLDVVMRKGILLICGVL